MIEYREDTMLPVRKFLGDSLSIKPTASARTYDTFLEVDTSKQFVYSARNINPATGNGWWEVTTGTPEKGVDYFTPEEILDIEEDAAVNTRNLMLNNPAELANALSTVYTPTADMIVLLKKICDLNGLTYSDPVVPLKAVYNSAASLVKDIKVGWNLGNALENINTATPYEVGIYCKNAYKAWLAVLNSGSKYFGGCTAITLDAVTGVANINWTIGTITAANYADAIGNISIQVSNYAIGLTESSQLEYTITNATITKSGGTAQTLTLLNDKAFAQDRNSSGVCAKYIPFIESGFSTMQDLAGATIMLTLTVTGWLVPSAPLTKEAWYESQTKNAPVTKAILTEIKKKGFNLVRFPISWFQHETAGLVFDQAWLDRIKQVVDWCMELDLFCIINTHHDDRVWLYPYADATAFNAMLVQFNRYWTTIATMFKDYDHRLIMEGYNEILDTTNSWSAPTAAEQDALDVIAQNFVNTVRGTGSKNADRILSINTYGAMGTWTYFTMPTDTVVNKLLVQMHFYDPQEFCWPAQLVTNGKTPTAVYNEATHGVTLTNLFNAVYTKFVSQGIPVIVGEFAAYNKINTAARVLYATSYITKARTNGIKCVWWDDGGDPARTNDQITNGTLFDRKNLVWKNVEVADALVAAANTEITENIPIEPTAISLSAATLSFTTADTQTLIATKTPSTTTYLVAWDSSNANIAQVSGGVVTPLQNGTVTITARLGEFVASCTVTIAAFNNTTAIDVTPASNTFTGSAPVAIAAALTPVTSTDPVVWTSSVPSVASVLTGVIMPISNGQTVITGTSNGVTDTCDVTVNIPDGSTKYYGSQVGIGPDFTLPEGYNYFCVTNGGQYVPATTRRLYVSKLPMRTDATPIQVRLQGQTIVYDLVNNIWVPFAWRLASAGFVYSATVNILYTNHTLLKFNDSAVVGMAINYVQADYE